MEKNGQGMFAKAEFDSALVHISNYCQGQKHKQILRKEEAWIVQIKCLVAQLVKLQSYHREAVGSSHNKTNLAITIIDEIEILTFVTRYFFNNFELQFGRKA